MEALGHCLHRKRFKIAVLLLAILGAVIAQLPDLLPDSDLISAVPHLAELDAGLANLYQFDEKDSEGKAIAVLRRDEEGHAAIYSILRMFNPNMPHLEQLPTGPSPNNVGAIISREVFGWGNPYGNIPGFRPVLVGLPREGALVPVPVCDQRDVAFRIHDQKVRFWSRLGICLTIIALILSFRFGEPETSKPSEEQVAASRNNTSDLTSSLSDVEYQAERSPALRERPGHGVGESAPTQGHDSTMPR